MEKEKGFEEALKYWKAQLAEADNKSRKEHCARKVRQAEKKVANPESYAGY